MERHHHFSPSQQQVHKGSLAMKWNLLRRLPLRVTCFVSAFRADLWRRESELHREVFTLLPSRWRIRGQMWRQRCSWFSHAHWFSWQAAPAASTTRATVQAGFSSVRRARWSSFLGTSPPMPLNCKWGEGRVVSSSLLAGFQNKLLPRIGFGGVTGEIYSSCWKRTELPLTLT